MSHHPGTEVIHIFTFPRPILLEGTTDMLISLSNFPTKDTSFGNFHYVGVVRFRMKGNGFRVPEKAIDLLNNT
jgi:hypothetical protein